MSNNISIENLVDSTRNSTGIDLRLRDFFPGLNIPIESAPSISAGCNILLLSIYSLTTGNPSWSLFRIAVAPVIFYFIWDFGFGPYVTPANQVAVGMAVVAMYGLMRLLETTFDEFMDDTPSRWVYKGKELPLPTTFFQRLLFSIDLQTSLRGTSWFADTHWNWAPQALLTSPCRNQSRSQFIRNAIFWYAIQYLAIDILDTINKSRTWDTTHPYPITSLSILEQLVFSLSVCSYTILAITYMFSVISAIAVALGSAPANWPPMFDAPFSATSLADFWGRRWHWIFRRVFSR
ncbi:hypothetical protein BD410DRAFT_790837, partial [Rickenella mellea]